MKTPVVLPNPFMLIHMLHQKYPGRYSMHGTYEIADEICHIKDRYGHFACQIETPFFLQVCK